MSLYDDEIRQKGIPFGVLKATKTAPVDMRFASMVDKTKQCYSLYNEFLRCTTKEDVNSKPCQTLKFYTRELCPTLLLDDFKEKRENGVWPGVVSEYVDDFDAEEEEEEEAEEAAEEYAEDPSVQIGTDGIIGTSQVPIEDAVEKAEEVEESD